MKKYMLVIAFVSDALITLAGGGEYAVSRISPALLINAHAVVRMYDYSVDIQSLEKVVIKRRFAITILDNEGAQHARLIEWYDKLNEIRSIEGALYDATGSKIRSLKNKDIEDRSGFSRSDLATDDRYKLHNFYHKDFPYTVEYSVEEVQKHTMYLPGWIPVPNEFVSVEKSNFSMRVPKDYQLRYHVFNIQQAPVVIEEKDKHIYSWRLMNFLAITREFAAPSWEEITPSILFAPSAFKIEDYSGTMSNWNELGKFQNSLNKGRDILPPGIKMKVAELTKNLSTVEEKIDVLYRYLQSTTRYISIQLGLGGWQPFEAAAVAGNSYGDCKALSNYMLALLKEAGIRSHYSLIKAGDNAFDIITSFPSQQFNHVILCVPNGKDTVWLECTDQFGKAGYLGQFTGNRHAFVVTEEGGRIVPTAKYTINDNQQIRNVRAVLDPEGLLTLTANSRYTGMQQDDIQRMITRLSREKVKEHLEEELDLPTYDVQKFNYIESQTKLPQISESLDITVKNYATITGKRLFILPNIMSKSYHRLTADSSRKYDIQLGYAYADIDTVDIELPAGYYPEFIPKDVYINSIFGTYSAKVKLESNRIIYYRKFDHTGGRYPADKHKELSKFYEGIYKSDRTKIVLIRKDN